MRPLNVESPIYVESISVVETGYPIDEVSSFECSDEQLNRIWRTGVNTLKACMQNVYEDCPLREHGQYVADTRVQVLMNYY